MKNQIQTTCLVWVKINNIITKFWKQNQRISSYLPNQFRRIIHKPQISCTQIIQQQPYRQIPSVDYFLRKKSCALILFLGGGITKGDTKRSICDYTFFSFHTCIIIRFGPRWRVISDAKNLHFLRFERLMICLNDLALDQQAQLLLKLIHIIYNSFLFLLFFCQELTASRVARNDCFPNFTRDPALILTYEYNLYQGGEVLEPSRGHGPEVKQNIYTCKIQKYFN